MILSAVLICVDKGLTNYYNYRQEVAADRVDQTDDNKTETESMTL
jgi:hypothetical protein